MIRELYAADIRLHLRSKRNSVHRFGVSLLVLVPVIVSMPEEVKGKVLIVSLKEIFLHIISNFLILRRFINPNKVLISNKTS